MARCRSCGAEINFIAMNSGKLHPVDTVKHTMIKGEGKETLITDDGEIIRGTFASYEEGANASGYISHFATCPYADKFRRR